MGGFIVAFWPRKPRDSGMQLAYFRFCRRIHALFAPISCRTADDDNSINIEISVYYLFQIGLGRTKPLSRAVSGFVCLFTICVCCVGVQIWIGLDVVELVCTHNFNYCNGGARRVAGGGAKKCTRNETLSARTATTQRRKQHFNLLFKYNYNNFSDYQTINN